MWTQLQLSAADKAAAGLRMAVAVLLNSIWPENGSTLNRFRRLESSTALVFVLTDGRSEDAVATAYQGTSGVRALGSASLRALRDSDGPELAQVARAPEAASSISASGPRSAVPTRPASISGATKVSMASGSSRVPAGPTWAQAHLWGWPEASCGGHGEPPNG